MGVIIGLGRNFLVGMNGIAVHAECGYFHMVLFHGIAEFLQRLIIVQQYFGVAVHCSRMSAAAHFYHFYALFLQKIQRLVKGLISQCNGKYS